MLLAVVHELYVIQNIHLRLLRQEAWTVASADGGVWFCAGCLETQCVYYLSRVTQWYVGCHRLEISMVKFSSTLPVEEWCYLSCQHRQVLVYEHCHCCPSGQCGSYWLLGAVLSVAACWDWGAELWISNLGLRFWLCYLQWRMTSKILLDRNVATEEFRNSVCSLFYKGMGVFIGNRTGRRK